MGPQPIQTKTTRANVWPGNAAVAGEGTAPFEGQQPLECKQHCSTHQLYLIRAPVAHQEKERLSAKGYLLESGMVLQEKAALPRGLTWTQAFRAPGVDTELQMCSCFLWLEEEMPTPDPITASEGQQHSTLCKSTEEGKEGSMPFSSLQSSNELRQVIFTGLSSVPTKGPNQERQVSSLLNRSRLSLTGAQDARTQTCRATRVRQCAHNGLC